MGIDNSVDHKSALDIALELIKQLITLCSGVLALSATFIPSLTKQTVIAVIVLSTSWLSLIISLIFGINTISIMVQSQLTEEVDWSKDKGKCFASACKLFFVVGVGLLVAFAIVNVISNPGSLDSNNIN